MNYLTAHVTEALAQDPRTCVLGIQVEVVSMKLFLIGQVETEERRRAAEAVAREIAPEGMEIVNQIWVPTYDRPRKAEPLH